MNTINQYDPLLYNGNALNNKFHKLIGPDTKTNEKSQNLDFKAQLEKKHQIPNNIPSNDIHKIPSRNDILKHINGDESRMALYEASKEFESFFVEKMYKEMKKNIPKTGMIDGGFAEEIFDEMLLTERVKKMSNQTHLGLAEMIYKQLQQSKKPMDFFG